MLKLYLNILRAISSIFNKIAKNKVLDSENEVALYIEKYLWQRLMVFLFQIIISTEILCMIFLVMLAVSSGHFLKRSGHKYLQEAGLTTIIGIIVGFALRELAIGDTLESIQLHFNNVFMILLLPPIIFESGYNM